MGSSTFRMKLSRRQVVTVIVEQACYGLLRIAQPPAQRWAVPRWDVPVESMSHVHISSELFYHF